MTSFLTKVNNAPIYTAITQATSNGGNTTSPDWQKWMNQITNQVNVSNGYGNPSICLNSDFNFNTGAHASPFTNADGPPPVLLSEKWYIVPGSAIYTVTRETYQAHASDNTGSDTYINIAISSYDGDGSDFYIYQQFDGAQFLRQFQNATFSFSSRMTASSGTTIKCQMQMYFFYDDSAPELYKGTVSIVDDNSLSYATTFKTDPITGKNIGGAPYVQFRLAFLGSGTLNINYLKPEISDTATALYIDHALERARIDNS